MWRQPIARFPARHSKLQRLAAPAWLRTPRSPHNREVGARGHVVPSLPPNRYGSDWPTNRITKQPPKLDSPTHARARSVAHTCEGGRPRRRRAVRTNVPCLPKKLPPNCYDPRQSSADHGCDERGERWVLRCPKGGRCAHRASKRHCR